MPSNFSEIKSSLVNVFQKILKNIVSLGNDSTLETDLKPLKIGGENTILELSKTKVKLTGTLDAETINAEAVNVNGEALSSQFQYTMDVINYAAAQTTSYLPMGGYVIERTSTSNSNEFIAMVAPYDGTLERCAFRCETAQDGTIQFDILEGSDGTELPATDLGTKDTDVDIADDITEIIDFSSMTTGTNVITKGRIYVFKITTPSNSNDTNVTLVYKWDVTT